MEHNEIAVCAVDDLWEGELIECRLDDTRTAIVLNIGGEISAYDNACPHQGSPLSAGGYDEGIITCLAHMWEFDAKTGQGVNPCTKNLTPIAVTVRDGVIYLRPVTRRAAPCR